MGRPKLTNVKRDTTTGRSRGQRPDEIVATALAHRVKHFGEVIAIKYDTRTGAPIPNHLAGFTLGLLRQTDTISEDQFKAGEWYAGVVYRYCGLYGLPLPVPKSPNLIFAGGASCKPDPDEELVLRARRQHSDARRALLDVGMSTGVGSRVNKIVFEVAIENRGDLSEADIGNLRVGLNALGRLVK